MLRRLFRHREPRPGETPSVISRGYSAAGSAAILNIVELVDGRRRVTCVIDWLDDDEYGAVEAWFQSRNGKLGVGGPAMIYFYECLTVHDEVGLARQFFSALCYADPEPTLEP